MTSQGSLVQRLIAFLRKPDALEYDRESQVHNPYDDYAPREIASEVVESAVVTEPEVASAAPRPADEPIVDSSGRLPGHASRLDAVVMRAVQQFSAQLGFVIRYDADGRMRYCTGRDLQGRYVPHTDVVPDRRAIFLALDSGESQLFVHTLDDNTPAAILCGPLWGEDKVIGVLYLDNPARSRLHRGVFDVFCDQLARMLNSGYT